MKKLLSFIFVLCTIPLTACAEPAPAYKEGTHYEVLNKQASSKPEIKEFFSFYCPHCFAFEPIAEDIKKDLPEGVDFKRSHVDFMPRNNKEVATGLGKSLAALQLIKEEEKGVAAIFRHIHKDRKQFGSMTNVRDTLVSAGIDPEKYDAAFNSFIAAGQANQMSSDQKTYDIRSVPTLIVNGKYKVLSRGLKSEDDYKKLINFLLEKK
ncbi:thiol:disulfide interchange protein DsbA/DsbL [Catenovulum sp. 2E275]|uniref:thiol:disulfide interchange protein DsbA/DsbL n=1 Tax=Catenovulum sp. 2E275 TaxID=2980497 RepID=UPI0021D39A15|nr:thiol:disulfide interchange protein DsbA/DsbL [Catenovulum sp. 2E275]MCU4677070.1 thiol:disulfide interchange protein DsbA/DsbL [Catenovulum sp. 2E275]